VRQTTDLTRRQEFSVATGHSKLKFSVTVTKYLPLNFTLRDFGTLRMKGIAPLLFYSVFTLIYKANICYVSLFFLCSCIHLCVFVCFGPYLLILMVGKPQPASNSNKLYKSFFCHIKRPSTFKTEAAKVSKRDNSFVGWEGWSLGKLHFLQVFIMRDTTDKKKWFTIFYLCSNTNP
jgi:hypothetical protein